MKTIWLATIAALLTANAYAAETDIGVSDFGAAVQIRWPPSSTSRHDPGAPNPVQEDGGRVTYIAKADIVRVSYFPPSALTPDKSAVVSVTIRGKEDVLSFTVPPDRKEDARRMVEELARIVFQPASASQGKATKGSPNE